MKFERTQTLAIDGKVINVSRIGEKTLAQFKQQLKQNGLEIAPERLQSVYESLGGGKTDEELQAMIDEAEKANVEQSK